MDQIAHRMLREERLHGDDSFPLEVYWIEREPGENVLDCHWHEEAEFFFVLEGKALFQVDTDYFHVGAGEAVFIDGGDIHAGHVWAADSSCSYCAIVFDPRLLDSSSFDAVQTAHVAPLQARTRTFPRRILPGTEWENRLLASLHAIAAAFASRRTGFQAFIKGHLFLMLHEIADKDRSANRSISSIATAKVERLKSIILYMQENHERPIRIQELADRIPMSEGQFCRFFKSMTRMTPIEYLNAYRIKRAAQLLRATDRKVSDIALEVGFDHFSYFIKVFQKIMRATPSEYRKEALTVQQKPE